MNEDWETSIAFVLQMEGDYTNDPSDPGGETKFGISKKAYPNLDIQNLTVDDAKAIYKKDYWEPCHCDELPFAFAIAVFDCAVNQGPAIARRMLQMALKVEVDGAIGPITIKAAFKAGPSQIKKLLALRFAEYARLMSKNPSLLNFAVNWSYRVVALTALIFSQPK